MFSVSHHLEMQVLRVRKLKSSQYSFLESSPQGVWLQSQACVQTSLVVHCQDSVCSWTNCSLRMFYSLFVISLRMILLWTAAYLLTSNYNTKNYRYEG